MPDEGRWLPLLPGVQEAQELVDAAWAAHLRAERAAEHQEIHLCRPDWQGEQVMLCNAVGQAVVTVRQCRYCEGEAVL